MKAATVLDFLPSHCAPPRGWERETGDILSSMITKSDRQIALVGSSGGGNAGTCRGDHADRYLPIHLRVHAV